MKFIVAGGSGWIGGALIEAVKKRGDQVICLSRKSSSADGSVVQWDGRGAAEWVRVLDGADAVINLCGESVAGPRWTAARKHALRDSRIVSTRAIAEGISRVPNPPKVWINGSAVGFYGDSGDLERTEESSAGSGFLAGLCKDWEEEALRPRIQTRRVIVRIGLVLGPAGGVLAKLAPLFNCYLGGSVGGGRQWVPWIHRDDLVRILLFAADQPSVHGVVNAVSPYPVRMVDFAALLAKSLNRPSWLPVPAFALKVVLGEQAQMLLSGQRVIPQALKRAGFEWNAEFLSEALGPSGGSQKARVD